MKTEKLFDCKLSQNDLKSSVYNSTPKRFFSLYNPPNLLEYGNCQEPCTFKSQLDVSLKQHFVCKANKLGSDVQKLCLQRHSDAFFWSSFSPGQLLGAYVSLRNPLQLNVWNTKGFVLYLNYMLLYLWYLPRENTVPLKSLRIGIKMWVDAKTLICENLRILNFYFTQHATFLLMHGCLQSLRTELSSRESG